MQNRQLSEEIVSLTRDVRENLSYLHELGIESADAPNEAQQARSLPTHPEDDIQESLPRRPSVSQPLLMQNVSASRGSVLQPGVPPAKLPATPIETLFGDLRPGAGRLEPTTETFEEIWADIGNCTRCPLHQGRTNIVHTEGNRRARLMFVGEAPGADEDAQARPFVGRAGQLLTKIIEAIGFKREEVLIGNVNRCRPPGNRPPTEDEATICKPFLLREIAAVQPEVIVVMGNTAMRNLLNTKQGITRLRGEFQDYRGVKVMPTFHPAYLLRDPSKKQETWQDLKKVRDYLEATARNS